MNNTAKTKITKNDGEFRVRLFIDNEYQAGADYFTDCLSDAKSTAETMKANASFSDKENSVAIEEQREFDEESIQGKEDLYIPATKLETRNPMVSEYTGNVYRYCVEVSDGMDEDNFFFSQIPTACELIKTIGEDLDTQSIAWIVCKVIDSKQLEEDWLECEFATSLICNSFLSIARFNYILSKNKLSSPHGICVDLLEDRTAERILIETGTGCYTAAVKENGEIVAVSAPAKKDGSGIDYLSILFERIFELGGRWLNCFDGKLCEIYSRFGFKERARVPFNPEFKPTGWDLNERGQPDIVFFRKSKFKSISIPYDSYEDAESFLISGGLVWTA